MHKKSDLGERLALTHLMLVDVGPELEEEIATLLPTTNWRWSRFAGDARALEAGTPDVILVTDHSWDEASEARRLLSEASAAAVPILAVLMAPPPAILDGFVCDDWVTRGTLSEELPTRLAQLSQRRSAAQARAGNDGRGSLADERFFRLVVHDLRTPLNVISLSLSMIKQAVPRGDPDLEEDLRFVEENFQQIERMLSHLSDFSRLFESDHRSGPVPFSPRRLVSDLLEEQASKVGGKKVTAALEVDPTCPEEVTLDPIQAASRSNMCVATRGTPVAQVRCVSS